MRPRSSGTTRESLRGARAHACLRPDEAGAPAGVPACRSGRSESQSGAGRDHRCTAGAHGGDDLLGVDALEVDRGRAEVGVLDMRVIARRRGELKRVRVAQLMRREPTPDARVGGAAAKLAAHRGARPRSPPRVGPSMMQNSGPTGRRRVRSAMGAAAPRSTSASADGWSGTCTMERSSGSSRCR
jgi:hypothetical protein